MSERRYRLATIRPVGVIIRPPMTSWIKPSSTKRAMRAGGIARLRKPVAISYSEASSAGVRSDCVGSLFIGPNLAFVHQQGSAWRIADEG